MKYFVALLLTLFATTATASGTALIVLDDLTYNELGAYSEGSPLVTWTTDMDGFALEGVVFTGAFAMPVCTPLRCTIATGSYPSRTGCGLATKSNAISSEPSLSSAGYYGLDPNVPSIFWVAHEQGRKVGCFGKWHMAGPGNYGGSSGFVASHPIELGCDEYDGTIGNFNPWLMDVDEPTGYGGGSGDNESRWERVRSVRDPDGTISSKVSLESTYVTTSTMDSAIDFVQRMEAAGEDWFLYVAPNFSHAPIHVPPASLTTSATESLCAGDPVTNKEECIYSMTEAGDMELGRLLDVMGSTVDTVILSDNGTTSTGARNPYDATNSKNTQYRGGSNVIFMARGPSVTASVPATTSALVSAPDVFSLVAGLMGSTAQGFDSVDISDCLVNPVTCAPRKIIFSEKYYPSGTPKAAVADLSQHMIHMRYQTYSLAVYLDADFDVYDFQLFDTSTDPYEAAAVHAGSVPADQTGWAAGEITAYDAMVTYWDCIVANSGVGDPSALCDPDP